MELWIFSPGLSRTVISNCYFLVSALSRNSSGSLCQRGISASRPVSSVSVTLAEGEQCSSIRGLFLLRPCGFCFCTSFPISHWVWWAGLRRRPCTVLGARVGTCLVSVPTHSHVENTGLCLGHPVPLRLLPEGKCGVSFYFAFWETKKKRGIFPIVPLHFY